jgi:hypothetical protein
MNSFAKRLQALEVNSDTPYEGCRKCRGLLVVIRDVVSGEFHSAHLDGEEITEELVRKHDAEKRCSVCQRELDHEKALIITLGGPKHQQPQS